MTSGAKAIDTVGAEALPGAVGAGRATSSESVRPARFALMALLTLFAVLTLALAPTGQATLGVGAGTYFLKGTQTPKDSTSDQQVIDQQTEWIVAATGAPPPQPLTVVDYPAQMWPFSDHPSSDLTLEESVAAGIAALPSPRDIAPGTLFSGGSQGAIVSSLYKREFNQAWAGDPQNAPAVTFVLTRNEMRPNGGVLSRFGPAGFPYSASPSTGPHRLKPRGRLPGRSRRTTSSRNTAC